MPPSYRPDRLRGIRPEALVNKALLVLSLVLLGLATPAVRAQSPTVISPIVTTDPLASYDEAPGTPDADDPAVWIDREDPRRSLVIGTAKDAGLLVYDLSGRLRQAIRPPNAPHVSADDPPTPAGTNLAADAPCAESASGETFGRFNNVDIAYRVRLGTGHRSRWADIAVVSDRGCDRVRFYVIDPSHLDGPLVDVTAPDVPRVFPLRYNQPSAVQGGEPEGWGDNPLDDQNTVYGLTVTQDGRDTIFVTERERGLVRQLSIVATLEGRLTYRLDRTFLFDTSFDLVDGAGQPYGWTPCREAVQEEPQSEGLVYDSGTNTLFVAFETIGLYRIPLRPSLPAEVLVTREALIEAVTTFGRGFVATPDDDEFECEYDAEPTSAPDDLEAPGSPVNAGRVLAADLEGLSVIASAAGQTLLLASSQGDSSFHFYLVKRGSANHLAAFFVDGVGETDGVHYAPIPLGPRFPLGVLVVQNGAASEPPDTSPINGYEFDGATQFVYVSFLDALRTLTR
jgi:3-phytase